MFYIQTPKSGLASIRLVYPVLPSSPPVLLRLPRDIVAQALGPARYGAFDKNCGV